MFSHITLAAAMLAIGFNGRYVYRLPTTPVSMAGCLRRAINCTSQPAASSAMASRAVVSQRSVARSRTRGEESEIEAEEREVTATVYWLAKCLKPQSAATPLLGYGHHTFVQYRLPSP